MVIGNHLSCASGYEIMGQEELKLGGNTFAFFTRNPRGGAVREHDPEDAARLCKFMQAHNNFHRRIQILFQITKNRSLIKQRIAFIMQIQTSVIKINCPDRTNTVIDKTRLCMYKSWCVLKNSKLCTAIL